MAAHTIPSRIWELYNGCPLCMRLLAWARTLICPFDKVLSRAPVEGRFIEIGCGTGICANLLALDSPTRSVAGYDLNSKVIAAAKQTVRSRPNIAFEAADVRDAVAHGSADVVVAVDLFHHLVPDVQVTVIQQVYQLLRPGGFFLLKEIDRCPRWKYYANWLHDAVMAGGTPHIWVRDNADYCRLLHAANFTVEVVPMPKAYLSHVLFVCRR